MSYIDFVQKRVVLTDTNFLGLTDEWVEELKADGYEIIDRRTKDKQENG